MLWKNHCILGWRDTNESLSWKFKSWLGWDKEKGLTLVGKSWKRSQRFNCICSRFVEKNWRHWGKDLEFD